LVNANNFQLLGVILYSSVVSNCSLIPVVMGSKNWSACFRKLQSEWNIWQQPCYSKLWFLSCTSGHLSNCQNSMKPHRRKRSGGRGLSTCFQRCLSRNFVSCWTEAAAHLRKILEC